MFQVAGLGIFVAIFSSILKKNAVEQGMLLVLAFGVAIFLLLVEELASVLDTMKNLVEIAQIQQELLIPIVKTVAISIVTKITGEICRSVGEGGVASFIDFAGAVLALVIALPLLEGVMAMMVEML